MMDTMCDLWPRPGDAAPGGGGVLRNLRYAFGERVLVPSDAGTAEVYFLTSYRRPSGIGGYRVFRRVDGKKYNRTDRAIRAAFFWDTGHGVGNYSTNEPLDVIEKNHSGENYRTEFFVAASVSKVEKFYPEDER
jgi:hypothetical protein